MKMPFCALSCLLFASVIATAADADTLMPYNAAGKWGFVARDATKVDFAIPPTFEFAYPFRQGIAAVRENKLWGFIDEKGTLVVPCQYDEVQKGILRAGVAVVKKAGLYGVIDRAGKEILPLKFKSVALDETAGRLIASIYDPTDANQIKELCGLYDLTGKQLLPQEYGNIYQRFKGGVSVVEKEGKRALLSSDGKLLSPLVYEQVLHSDIPHFIAMKDAGKTADVYDEHGRLLFSAPYPYVGALNDDRAVFKDPATKFNGYLDSTGKIVLPAQFVMAGAFSEGLAIVQRKTLGPVEAIDTKGNTVGSVATAFIRLDKFKHGHVWLADRTDKKVYLYNTRLEKELPLGFYYAADFDDNGLARAQSAPKVNGLINAKGEWVVQPEWTLIEASSIPGQYIVSKDRERGIVNAAGQMLFKPQGINIEKWDEQFVKFAPPGFFSTGEYHCFYRRDGLMFYSQK